MTTFAGYPLHTLADLPAGRRAELLQVLASDCEAATQRHHTILANRAAAVVRHHVESTAALLGWTPAPPLRASRTGATRCTCGHQRLNHRGGHACTATGCTCPRMTPIPARRTA